MLLAIAPKPGTDTVIITHKLNIIDALGKDWFDAAFGFKDRRFALFHAFSRPALSVRLPLGPCPTSAAGDKEIANALRAGGLIIVLRRGSTFRDQADTDPLHHPQPCLPRLNGGPVRRFRVSRSLCRRLARRSSHFGGPLAVVVDQALEGY